MKVLLSHEFYRSSAPSGEDAVFENELAMLERAGIEVSSFAMHNDDIDETGIWNKLALGIHTVWSRRAYREIREILQQCRPDVAHFHNTFPMMSPSVYAACQAEGIPVVQTLHNYRFVCPGALLLRDERPCELCLDGGLWHALRHRCYRHSTLATGAIVSMLAANRAIGSYRRQVDRYIALTQFAASRLAAGGLPQKKITVKPNFLPEPPPSGNGNGGFAIYVGRLSREKGVHTLLKAWKQVDALPLKFVGAGPMLDELRASPMTRNGRVEFLGSVPRGRVLELIRDAVVQIVPSEWYEGFPMVVLEAYASGTPIIASRIGSLEEVVIEGQTGALFEAGNAIDCAKVVRHFLNGSYPSISRRRVRQEFEDKYTESRNLEMLLQIYEEAKQ